MSLNASRLSGEPAPAAGRSRRPAESLLPAAAFAAVMAIEGAEDRPISADHDRCLTPEATLSRIRPHFASLGITRLGEITGLDSLGIPVAFATRPNSFSLSVNLGKGRDQASARASAAMEAAEIAIAERAARRRDHRQPERTRAGGARYPRSRPDCALPTASARPR